MTPIDERMRDLADRAADQCEALATKLTAILDGVDEDGDDEPETLRGLATDKGRLGLIFAEDGVSHRRTWVYVDAILDLAEMIRREPVAALAGLNAARVTAHGVGEGRG